MTWWHPILFGLPVAVVFFVTLYFMARTPPS